ncbi:MULTISPECIES: DoxX family protein [unclassified Rhizobium]|uniref:DoxX family protein n=1 Tax=unclassified Rhizobium TaxID=2613769 RepID=UPI00382C08E6
MSFKTTKSEFLTTVPPTPARLLAGVVESYLGKPWFGYLARTVLTFMFWSSGLAKLFDFAAGLAEMRHFGLVPEVLFFFATVITLLLGSILVILDRWTWMAAGALAAFTVLTIPIAHNFWTMEEPMRTMEFHVVMEHITVVGGLFIAIYASAIGKRARVSMQA